MPETLFAAPHEGEIVMATKKKTSAPARSIEDMSVEELQSRVETGREHVRALAALFPGLLTLTEEDRTHSQGRMRAGEAQVIGSVLDAVDASPAYFTSLADVDEGHDPNVFETGLLRERLAKRELMQGLAAELAPVSNGMADSVLHFGGQVRPPTLAAYRLGKVVAQTDRKMRGALAMAIDFYGAPAKAAARKRAASKKPA